MDRRRFLLIAFSGLATATLAACGARPARRASSNPEADLSLGSILDQPADIRGILGFGANQDISQTMDPAGNYEGVAGEAVLLWLRAAAGRPAQRGVTVQVDDWKSAEALGINGVNGSPLTGLQGLRFPANQYKVDLLAQNPGTGETELREYAAYELAGNITSLQGTISVDPGTERGVALSGATGLERGRWAVGIRFYPDTSGNGLIVHENAAVLVTHVLGQAGNEISDAPYQARLAELGTGYDLSVPAQSN